jgi:uroporphyrinogen decarboxylase
MNIFDLEKPIWFMRQAGRHLPEYKVLRAQKTNFLEFCFDYESIVKSTLQPIERYDLDCAIIFSDILVIPYILNQQVDFIQGVGPKLECLEMDDLLDLTLSKKKRKNLSNCYRAIKRVRKLLNKNKCLIGFSGAPWTVMCYMIDGDSKSGFERTKRLIKSDRLKIKMLLKKIIEVSVEHLIDQYKSGCDTLMIFESWAGCVDFSDYDDFLYDPVLQILKRLRNAGVKAPVIVFPKGVGKKIVDYINHVPADIIGIDHNNDIRWVIKNIEKNITLQGNIDPEALLLGGEVLEKNVRKLIETVNGRKHIFNLGHGMLPETPIANVHKIIDIIRS